MFNLCVFNYSFRVGSYILAYPYIRCLLIMLSLLSLNISRYFLCVFVIFIWHFFHCIVHRFGCLVVVYFYSSFTTVLIDFDRNNDGLSPKWLLVRSLLLYICCRLIPYSVYSMLWFVSCSDWWVICFCLYLAVSISRILSMKRSLIYFLDIIREIRIISYLAVWD